MVKKFLILALFLPILVSCKDNKRIIESNSSEILSKENKKSDNNIANEDSNKEDSNLSEKNSQEKKEEIDPIFDILNGKKFVYKHVHNRFYQSLQFGKNGFFNSKYTFTQTDTSGEFTDYQSICQMQGSFVVENKMDDKTYTLRLINPSITSETGKSEIVSDGSYKNNIEYKDLKGGLAIDDSQGVFQDLYTLYLPGKNVDEIKDEVKQNLALLYINFEGENTYYFLVNNKTNAVFIEGIE